MQAVEIREATVQDAEAIASLAYALTDRFIAGDCSPPAREVLLKSMLPEAIKEYLEIGYRYHVAELDGRIVGVVGVRDNRHLYHLFVAEAHQHKGIARALWGTAMTACLAAGNPGEFTVNASRYARPLYQKLGFVTESGPLERNGVVAIPMRLRLVSMDDHK